MPAHHFAYASHTERFLALDPLQDQPFAVVGVPFDGGVTHRPGARLAPQAVRAASLMLCDGIHPHFDLSPLGVAGDAGDLRVSNAAGVAVARAEIAAQAAPLLQRHHCVFLGGDHSITLPLLAAAAAAHPELALIHFDAHSDAWTDHFGEPAGHGTWVHEALAAGLVAPAQCVQIGLRSSGIRAARDYVADLGGLVYPARALRGLDGAALQPVIDAIVARVGQRACYLSFDIDCLDPAFAPGTGTPEPGGLSTSQVFTLLEGLSVLRCVAMDCVEVCPPYDHAELTSLAAATLVWTYLCGQMARQAGRLPA